MSQVKEATEAKESKVENQEAENSKPNPPAPAFERSISEIEADLRKPIPKQLIRQRRQGGTQIDYISWYDAVKIMSYYAAGWSSEIARIDTIGGKLIMTVRVLVPTKHGVVSREATGQEEEEGVKFGDSTSNAESMALRRAFAKFGLGIGLYDKK